jgi:hypothetical protein
MTPDEYEKLSPEEKEHFARRTERRTDAMQTPLRHDKPSSAAPTRITVAPSHRKASISSGHTIILSVLLFILSFAPALVMRVS